MSLKEEICTNLARDLIAFVELLNTPSGPPLENKLYTFAELGEMMGKSKDTIRQWVCAGQFGEPVKVGNSIRVTQAGLDKYITDHSGPIQKKQFPSRRKRRPGLNPDGEPFGI